MANKKGFKKYTATTMAAAAAVTTVVPMAASADTEGFPDVSESNDHYENIMKLSEQGIIKGYSNGDFGPYDSITRGQVAAMLTNALELPVPEDIDKVLEQYSDVNSDDRYAEEVAAVTAANIFKGSDGNFNRYANMSRQQMATVLVEGFDLKDYDTDKDVKINRDNISDSHVENVQVLANLDITTQADDFRAYEDLSRGQFSTFLVKTLELTEEIVVDSVNAVEGQTIDSSSDEQYLNFTINNNREVSIDELQEAGYTIDFLTSKEVLNDADDAQPNELDKSKLSDVKDFTYQVEISKDGEIIATSKQAAVKVEDFSKVVTEITNIVPVVDEQEKHSHTVTEENEISFHVYGYKKDNPEDEVDVTNLVDSVSSSQPTILYINNDSTATAIKSGNATVTVKAGDQEATQKITVADAAPEIESLTTDVESINTIKGNKKTVKVTVKDQYGDPVKDESVSASFDEEDIAALEADEVDTDSKGVAEFTVTGEAQGKTTLTLEANNKTVEIPVEVQEAGDVDYYALNGEDQFDLADVTTQEYTLQGYDEKDLESGDSVELPTTGGTYYEVDSSDESVAEATIEGDEVVVTGEKAGKVTVTLSKYEGTLSTPSETFTKEIVIEDSRAQLVDATLAEDLPEFTSGESIDLSEVVTDLTVLPSTTAYELKQGNDDTQVKIMDTNEEVTNNALGTIDVAAPASEDLNVKIEPKNDSEDAVITLDAEDEATDKNGPVIVTVKDANDKVIRDVALDVNLD